MTTGSPCYLDHYQGNPYNEPHAFGGNNTLSKVYSFNPIPQELPKQQHKYILGAQGNVWTEYILSPEHVEYMAYPRAIAMAEVNWSPQKIREFKHFMNHLEHHFIWLDMSKVNYRKLSLNEETGL